MYEQENKEREKKWSFAELDDNNVIRVKEKDPISDYATVGWYYFKEGKDFISKLLIVDPAKRLTSDRVNKHPWLARRAELGVAYLNSPKAFRGAKEKKSSKSWRARLLSTGDTRLM